MRVGGGAPVSGCMTSSNFNSCFPTAESVSRAWAMSVRSAAMSARSSCAMTPRIRTASKRPFTGAAEGIANQMERRLQCVPSAETVSMVPSWVLCACKSEEKECAAPVVDQEKKAEAVDNDNVHAQSCCGSAAHHREPSSPPPHKWAAPHTQQQKAAVAFVDAWNEQHASVRGPMVFFEVSTKEGINAEALCEWLALTFRCRGVESGCYL